ncbi:MAG: glutamate-5-semialdehyde dehydrogenase [Eubacteriales bacterium]|nr:glutamate-5-semialdehyde dehydrogenase [Eubacteriales bacterium]
MTIQEKAAQMKLDSPKLAATPAKVRDHALELIAQALLSHKNEILGANARDLQTAEQDGVSAQVMKRLRFDEHKLTDVIRGIHDLIALPDPLARIQLKRELDSDLLLERVSCPIGVIGVIFEARPDALVQIASLCLKSGNCVILKGGSETMHTNRCLFALIHQAAVKGGLPESCMFQAEARSEINELLSCHESVDLLIPRGSNAFVRYIMEHSQIPVMGHSDGICHIYVDKDADIAKAIPVIVDAKSQYTAACNAAETLLIHRDIADALLPPLYQALRDAKVEVRGTQEIRRLIDCLPAKEEDFSTEYLDLIISIKLVDSIEEAIDHINRYGSHHTDAILTENADAAEQFMRYVDSAGVYQNCSTRFADGFRYGFGAEVGISTGKLHARGPVGLEGLCTYKYQLFGNGNIVGDYASGIRQFHFQDLDVE